ncbi:MAG TPA: helix-turn-helix domain-containing protein [Pirellulales bacterium]|jgi:AcrR family transcriptional regulator|nr:helix-turn-helix domain-containing protein [Pirellulales bacterium]
MKATLKLSSEERRAAIIQAVRRVFAEKGFHGTTTRELALAANVSEALLFKHFPNKEALYSAMQHACCGERESGKIERLKALEPSTATLVVMVHLLVSKLADKLSPANDDDAIQVRLVLRSLMEDGEFATLLLQRVTAGWFPKVEESLQAAIEAGDAVAGPVTEKLSAWFVHHLAVALMLYQLPTKAVIDYGMPREQLIRQAAWFALRGMGLTEDAIRRNYQSETLAVLEG